MPNAATASPPPADAPPLRAMTFQPDIYPRVMDLIPRDRNASVLDVGAGQGYFCSKLLEAGYKRVRACDFNPGQFRVSEVACARANLNESLPFEDSSFDCAVSIEVAEHLEHHFRYFEELFRVVKPGGLVIVTTPNVVSLPARVFFLLHGFSDASRKPIDPRKPDYYNDHIHPIALPDLLFQVERCGGELVELTTNRLRRSAWAPYVLFGPLLKWNARRRLMKRRYADLHDLARRRLEVMHSKAALLGRIAIVVARRAG